MAARATSSRRLFAFWCPRENSRKKPARPRINKGVGSLLLQESQTELIEACQTGGPEAFRALFEQYKDRVYTVALRFAGSPEAADDITQDTFLKLFSAIRTYQGPGRFDAWLYRLVVNACFDHRRRTHRFLPILDLLTEFRSSPEPSPQDDLLISERDHHLYKAVAKLPDDQRIAVVLRYSQGLSYEEIGTILDCPPGTVASRLNRAHSTLERRLRNRFSKELPK